MDQPSGTVTLVFTDIEGSTRLLQELGQDAYRDALHRHRDVVRAAFEAGYEVDTEGDAFFYAFASAQEAVAAVEGALRGLEAGPIRIRIGVHTGEPGLDPPKYVGMDVHRAARIMAAGHGGQALLSDQTARLVQDTVALRDLGEHRLKDLSASQRLWQLGEGEFPPPKTLYRSNLPVPATEFLGREREVAEIAGSVIAERLVTLTGPGGTGKTRLAIQAAGEAAEAFPDGVRWLALAPIADPSLALSAVAGAVEVSEQPGHPLAATLDAALSGKHMLLVLDNAEHLLPEVAQDIAMLRDTNGPRILVTSRERLQLAGERVVPVAALDDDEAIALFVERAAGLGVTLERSADIAALCLRLDNLPLAIELAAARTTLFSPPKLLERLADRLDLLKGGRDADPRQQTLNATIEWSFDLLDAEERRVFQELSVFRGGCTIEAAADVCDADPETIQSLLDKSLLRKRLDETGSDRYWMLETIREFADARLRVSGDAPSAEDRLLKWAVDLAAEAETGWRLESDSAWLPRFAAELPNVRQALRLAFERNRAQDALAIATDLGWLWQSALLYREGVEWTERALEAVPVPDAGRHGMALLSLATFASDQGDRDRSEELARRSLPLLAAGGPHHDHVYALQLLAFTIDPASGEAEALLEEAQSEARALDDRVVLSRVLLARAAHAARVGELQEARALLDESLEHTSGDDDRAYALTYLAIVEIEENNLGRARDLLAEACGLTDGHVSERTLTTVKLVAAQVELLLGNASEAARHLTDVSEMIETSASYFVAVLRLCEAGLHRLLGDVSAADNAWRRAEELRTQLGFEWELTDAIVVKQVVAVRDGTAS